MNWFPLTSDLALKHFVEYLGYSCGTLFCSFHFLLVKTFEKGTNRLSDFRATNVLPEQNEKKIMFYSLNVQAEEEAEGDQGKSKNQLYIVAVFFCFQTVNCILKGNRTSLHWLMNIESIHLKLDRFGHGLVPYSIRTKLQLKLA